MNRRFTSSDTPADGRSTRPRAWLPRGGWARSSMLWLLLLAGHAQPLTGATTPNIIIIYADDLGYGDVGVYGATRIATPNIDRLAREGVRFTSGYASISVCSTTLGHANATVADPRYLDMVARGLPWACGKLDSSHLLPSGPNP